LAILWDSDRKLNQGELGHFEISPPSCTANISRTRPQNRKSILLRNAAC
jgi:hypothetical protein